MWNVYQYVKDFGNDKIKYEEFIDIYNRQKVLRDYIKDCYSDIVKHKLIDEYKALGGTINICDFINDSKNIEKVKKSMKALAILIDRIYK